MSHYFLRAFLRISGLLLLAAASFAETPLESQISSDVELRAMRDELARAKTIQLNNLDKPYFVQYTSSDARQFTATASLGGLLSSESSHTDQPKLQVRVGNYQFDNTNTVFSRESRFGLLPIDHNYLAIRDNLWLWTDLLYKASADQVAYKRTSMNEIAAPDKTPDFAPAKAVQIIQPLPEFHLDESAWNEEIRRLSGLFARYGNVMNSQVRVRSISSTYRLVNTEGTVVRIPQLLSDIDIAASTFAADGSRIWNHRLITAVKPEELPSEAQLTNTINTIGTETEALARAPLGEDYSGPVLFQGEAAAEMMAQVLSNTVRLQRKPFVPPGSHSSAGQTVASVWASRLGSRVLPEWMSLFDDPRQQRSGGVTLAGQYDVDDEGVPAERVTLVDKGVLKNFLLSRRPVRTFNGSNGHGRLPGDFGNAEAAFGNLFVQAGQSISEQQLKAKLIKRIKTSGLKFGFIIRRIDFPSTANLEELQSMVQQMRQSGFLRTLNAPILAYRVYPDGREELVRGFRFQEFSAKDLRDISAASNKPYVLNYVNNGSSLNLVNSNSDATTSSVICPSLLFESIDLARAEGEAGKLPLVPSPAIVKQAMNKAIDMQMSASNLH